MGEPVRSRYASAPRVLGPNSEPWPAPLIGDREDYRNADDEYTGVAMVDHKPAVDLNAIMFPRAEPGYGPGGYE